MLQSFLTFGDSHGSHSHATQNGDDRSRANSEEEHGGGWGFQRLWRRGDAAAASSAPHSEASEPVADGFGSVIGGRAHSPTSRPRNVFLPSAPMELRIKITR